MAVKKIEIQDSVGDVYHPHTTTDVVFHNGEALLEILKSLIKKDGSIPIEGYLKTKRTDKQNAWEYGQDTTGRYCIKEVKADGTTGQQFIFENQDFYPNNSNITELGTLTRVWKAVWAGSQSSSNSGFTSLPNGYMLQWKRHVLTFNNSASTSGTVSLPTSFPSNNFGGIAICCTNDSVAAVFQVALAPTGRGTFNIRAFRDSGVAYTGDREFLVVAWGN